MCKYCRTPRSDVPPGSDTRVRDASLSVRSDAIEMLTVEVEVEVVALLLSARPARCGLGTSDVRDTLGPDEDPRARATASKIRICSSLIPDASRDALCHRPLPSRAQCRARAVLDGSTARASFLSSAKMRVYVIRHAQSATTPYVRPPPPSRTETTPPSPRLARPPCPPSPRRPNAR